MKNEAKATQAALLFPLKGCENEGEWWGDQVSRFNSTASGSSC